MNTRVSRFVTLRLEFCALLRVMLSICSGARTSGAVHVWFLTRSYG